MRGGLFMLSARMKLPDIYGDWRVVTGLALIFLGAGNWWVGLSKARESSQIIAQAANVVPSTDYRSFDEIEAADDGAALQPPSPQGERVSYARARMDFYHVTFLTGEVIMMAGLLIVLWGFIAIIRNDTWRALKTISHSDDHDVPYED